MSTSIAFVFPGQGSQSVGMLSELSQNEPQIAATFTEANTVLDYDLWQLTQQGPEAQLNQTEYTQPALLTASVALWRVWQAHNQDKIKLKCLAGHSLGEYSALVAAEALSFTDAVKLVQARGRFMQAAVATGQGAMAAILGLDDQQVINLCQEVSVNLSTDESVEAANFNSPGQVVIAGTTKAVAKAIEQAKTVGARKAIQLAMSVPSHCSLMQTAAEQLRTMLNDIEVQSPKIPVIFNADVSAHSDAEAIRDALMRQLISPVRWSETIQHFEIEQQITLCCECGPGKVLTGLGKRIAKTIEHKALSTVDIADFAHNLIL